MYLSEKLKLEGELDVLLFDIVDKLDCNIYIKDLNGNFLGCNRTQLEYANLTSPELFFGKSDYDMPWKICADQLRAFDKKVIEEDKTLFTEEVITFPNGNLGYFLSKKSPLRIRGKLVGIIGVSIDIAKEKQIENLLQKQREIEQRNQQLQEQITALRRQAVTLAHELKTPLGSIKIGATTIQAISSKLNDASWSDKLFDVSTSIDSETNKMSGFINIILGNVGDISAAHLSTISILECITEALSRFPYENLEEKNKVNLISSEDFCFHGNKELMVHLLFNLIKNALYFVAKAGNGAITIWVEPGEKYNKLHFKDTGTGIENNKLQQIFDEFFTDTGVGTGIGLFFCRRVMQAFGGTIDCESKLGEYTHFTMTFPMVYTEKSAVKKES